MDGSSAAFVAGIDSVGIRVQSAPRRAIRIVKEVMVEHDGKRVRLKPADSSVFSGQIDFKHPAIGSQYHETVLYNGNFRHELAEARTFGFAEEVEAMRKMGLARGGSLDNAIVLDSDKVLNVEGLRFDDEFIRHKLLDAVGDLYLAGGPIIGAYEGFKAGHAMNNAILHELFAHPDAYVMVDQFDEQSTVQTPAPVLASAARASVAA
jgi:UDP-3-O-[3-hydroxymyristoyl] N-acetylglucosamine deacetylase